MAHRGALSTRLTLTSTKSAPSTRAATPQKFSPVSTAQVALLNCCRSGKSLAQWHGMVDVRFDLGGLLGRTICLDGVAL
jgi:hypothetical protein